MTHFETVWAFTTQQFVVELALAPEEASPFDTFEDGEAQDICNAIERGVYLWFCARVRVLWMGVEVGSDYLGGCCYESVEAFRDGGYFRDMVREAISDARARLSATPRVRAA